MPEATIVCCDCSEWMRNGDFMPTRFEAQKDALGVICNAKTEQNHENTVGLIAMGGDAGSASVLVNCTSDTGRILGSAHKMEIGGRCDILVALQTAQLALKHRKNKKQSQRIIVFVGSPITTKSKPLIQAAKKLKKNNVAVDVIDFGESEANADILASFIKAVNSSDGNCRLVTVPSGTTMLLSDHLVSSPVLQPPQSGISDLGFATGPDGGAVGAGGVGAGALGGALGGAPGGGAAPPGGFLGGVDPSLDPELAEVLRLSMQEAEAAQASRVPESTDAGPAGDSGAGDTGGSAAAGAGRPEISDEVRAMAMSMGMDAEDLDEETILALQMSMMEDFGDGAADPVPPTDTDGDATMSSATAVDGGGDAAADASGDADDYMNELLSALPGLDADDINAAGILDEPKDEDKDKPDGSSGGKGGAS